MKPTALLSAVVVVVALAAAAPAHAQFRNQGAELPNVGWLGLGTWDVLFHGGVLAESANTGWNIWDQPTIGAGYFFAIGYNLWVDSSAAIGVSTSIIDEGQNTSTPILTVNTRAGLRYNFMSERHRPFVSANLSYLQVIAFPREGVTVDIPFNGFLGNTPFFIGVNPNVGYEWVFGDEMSLKGELGATVYVVPDLTRTPVLLLPASMARLSYNVYF